MCPKQSGINNVQKFLTKIAIDKKISPQKFFQKPKYINGIITVVGGDIFGFLSKNKGDEKSPIFSISDALDEEKNLIVVLLLGSFENHGAKLLF